MTGKTHIAISAASVTLFILASGVRISRCPRYLQAIFTSGQGAVQPGADCADLCGAAALLILGVTAGLFPDLDVEGSSLERLPARAAAFLAGHRFRLNRQGAVRRKVHRNGRRGRAGAPFRDASIADLALTLLGIPLLLASQVLRIAGFILRGVTTHRGFTHTLSGAALFGVAVFVVTSFAVGISHSMLATGAWIAGYLSHLASDACTPSGVPLFRIPLVRVTARRGTRPGNRPNTNSDPRQYGARSRALKTPKRTIYAGLSSNLTAACTGLTTFHLLPAGKRVATGSYIDTVVLRWGGWTLCCAAAFLLFTVR